MLFKADLLLADPAKNEDQCLLLPDAVYDIPYFRLVNLFRKKFEKDLAGEAIFEKGRETPPQVTQNLSQFVRDFPKREAKFTSFVFPITSEKKGIQERIIVKRFFNPYAGNPYTGQAMAEIWTAERQPLTMG